MDYSDGGDLKHQAPIGLTVSQQLNYINSSRTGWEVAEP